MSLVTIRGTTTTGAATHEITLDFLAVRISVRDLIRKHVYEEVREYNQAIPGYLRSPVQPTETERILNGSRLRYQMPIDWEEQYHRALAAFDRNGFFIIVDDRQATSLDEEIDLAHDTTISFIKLVSLVGG